MKLKQSYYCFRSMKKDELIKLLTEKYSKINELETSLFHKKMN